MKRKTAKGKNVTVVSVLRKHFGRQPIDSLVTASRTFPVTSRVDLQSALTGLFAKRYEGRLIGVHSQYGHETLTVPHLTREGNYPVVVGPLQHDEVDVGDAMPVRCLKHGLWLSYAKAIPFGVLLTPAERFGQTEGVHIEIAVPPGEAGMKLSYDFLASVEKLVNQAGSYRGKVISLEATRSYLGKAEGVKVHK